MTRLLLCLAVACSLAAPAAASAATPLSLSVAGRTPALGEERSEIAAFHTGTNRLFVTNDFSDRLDVYTVDATGAPTPAGTITFTAGGAPATGSPTSVDVSRSGLVAVALAASPTTGNGKIAYYDAQSLQPLGTTTAGALPDMVTFTHSGRYLLAANEGEPAGAVDPDGSVTVVRLEDFTLGGALPSLTVKTATFGGVPVEGSPRSFTGSNPRDFEPEYITRAIGDRRAYVSIQEANAVGVLDIPRARFTKVQGLGYKKHVLGVNALDPSDTDGPLLRSYPNLLGMYQPDALAAYRLTVRGKPVTFIATANEGDARAGEDTRVGSLPGGLDAAAFPPPTPWTSGTELGRLNVSNIMGNTDADAAYERLYAFGGRSMSILDDDAEVVFDTGSELEAYAKANDPANFNKSNSASSVTDNRSDDKGPEPEGVAVGSVNGRLYSFVAAERSGGLYVYDLEAGGPGSAELVAYINTRPTDLGPEGVRFVRGPQSPTGKPLVIVSHEISGTVTIFEVSGGGA